MQVKEKKKTSVKKEITETNHVFKSLYTVLIVIGTLFLLQFVPEIPIFGVNTRKIDLLSDIRAKEVIPVLVKDKVVVQFVDTCKTGITCFEDYSPDKKALQRILMELVALKNSKNKVRIAVFGDSFIEGDIFTCDLRDTLQKVFGGEGVGFVPMVSITKGFRTSIGQDDRNFKSYTVTDEGKKHRQLSAGGVCYEPMAEASASFYPGSQYAKGPFQQARLLVKSLKDNIVYYEQNGKKDSILLEKSSAIKAIPLLEKPSSRLNLLFPKTDSLFTYGISFESEYGVMLDNFSIRGNSGMALSAITEQSHIQFDTLQNYSLIILQYGLNVATPSTKEFDWYIRNMKETIAMLKRCYPKANFLLLSVTDRATKQNGTFATMPSIPLLVETQRKIAKETGIAFWDLYSAMGGEGTMVRFVEAKPSLANKDYTHFNFRGGKEVAKVFMQTLLYEVEKQEKKIQHLVKQNTNVQ